MKKDISVHPTSKHQEKNFAHGFFRSGQLFSLIPQCCKEALPLHNQPLRFLWPSWLPSNSKEWTILPVPNESSNYSRFQKRKTPLSPWW